MKKSLAFKFSIFSLTAVLLPATAIALSLIVIGNKALTESLFAEQSSTVKMISDRIFKHMDNVRSMLSIAAQEPGLARFTKARQEESLRRLLRYQPSLKEVFVINASGMETSKLSNQGNRLVPNPDLGSRKTRPEFLAPMESGRSYVGEPFFSGDRLPYFFVSCPAYGRRAVLCAKVSMAELWALLKQIKKELPGDAYLVDPKGNLLAHPDTELVQMHTNFEGLPILKSIREGKTGRKSFGVTLNARGEKVVALAEKIPSLDWAVVREVPVAYAYAPIRTMEKEVGKWTLYCATVILIIAFWRVKMIVNPLERLQEGAQKISHGNLNFDPGIRTGDELELLSNSFRKMADSLRQLEQMRQDLISMLVHDLKSPLSGIMGGLDYCLDNQGGTEPENVRKVLGLARKSSEELSMMIQNLLDVAKMEEGKLTLKLEDTSPQRLITECAEDFRLQADRESKTLVCEVKDGLPQLDMDPQLIRRVLTNLLSNALRHTTSGGNIIVRGALNDGALEISVADDGEGVPEEYREKIFEKFVQAERKRAHLRSGTGLGLTFCRMTVELHGGIIKVDSEPGKGSTFKFTLPLAIHQPK